jgi:hypothetical protein
MRGPARQEGVARWHGCEFPQMNLKTAVDVMKTRLCFDPSTACCEPVEQLRISANGLERASPAGGESVRPERRVRRGSRRGTGGPTPVFRMNSPCAPGVAE